MNEDEEVLVVTVERRRLPFLVVALCQNALARAVGREKRWDIHWPEVWLDLLARFLAGMLVGVGLCVLLVPVLFWPGRFSRRLGTYRPSIYEALGEPDWIACVFLGVLIGCGLIWALLARVQLRVPRQQEDSLEHGDESHHPRFNG